LQDVFGGNKCTYESVTVIVDQSNECNKVAQEKWAAKTEEIVANPDRKYDN